MTRSILGTVGLLGLLLLALLSAWASTTGKSAVPITCPSFQAAGPPFGSSCVQLAAYSYSFSYSPIVPIASEGQVVAEGLMAVAGGVAVIAFVAMGVKYAFGFLKGRTF